MRLPNPRKIAALALLTAAALIIYIAEAQIPPLIAVPGVKLGLSNVIVLTALYLYGRKEAAAVLALKVSLGSFLSGQPSGFLYSAVGGALCLFVMLALKRAASEKQLWAVSAFGAIAFNMGQLAVAAAVMGSDRLLWYAPVLAISGVITGVFTGVLAQLVLPRLRKALDGGGK